jgi:hypothetical protein
MAAQDTFDAVVSSLTATEREQLKDYLRARRGDLLAARSEDARVRLTTELTEEVHDLLTKGRQARAGSGH